MPAHPLRGTVSMKCSVPNSPAKRRSIHSSKRSLTSCHHLDYLFFSFLKESDDLLSGNTRKPVQEIVN